MGRTRRRVGGEKARLAQSLGRGLHILEAFTREAPELGVTELGLRLGLAKSTVHRLLATLQARGYVRKNPRSGKYRLGTRAWEVGCIAAGQLGHREAGRASLERLAREAAETAHLAILDGAEVVYLDRVEGTVPAHAEAPLGGRVPAHAVSAGRALLAFLDPEALRKVLARGVRRFTPATIADEVKLREELEAIRGTGYAVAVGEWRAEVGSISAPVRDGSGEATLAVGVGAATTALLPERIEALAALVRAAAGRLSRELGFHGDVPAGAGPDSAGSAARG
jgi:DNA-binding IclR family transcriptional regulator